jgi:hypothetical protein
MNQRQRELRNALGENRTRAYLAFAGLGLVLGSTTGVLMDYFWEEWSLSTRLVFLLLGILSLGLIIPPATKIIRAWRRLG